MNSSLILRTVALLFVVFVVVTLVLLIGGLNLTGGAGPAWTPGSPF